MQTNVEKIKSEVLKLIEESKPIVQTMDELSEWNSIEEVLQHAQDLGKILVTMVCIVEAAVSNVLDDLVNLQSSDKQEALVQLLDEKIKFKNAILESLDGALIRIAISVTVATLNTLTKSWNVQLIKEYLAKGKNIMEAAKSLVGSN